MILTIIILDFCSWFCNDFINSLKYDRGDTGLSVFHTRYSKEIHYCGAPVIIITCFTAVILQLSPACT